jgi:hypothetical protein
MTTAMAIVIIRDVDLGESTECLGLVCRRLRESIAKSSSGMRQELYLVHQKTIFAAPSTVSRVAVV